MKRLLIPVAMESEARIRAAVSEAVRMNAIEPLHVHLVSVQPKVNGHVAMFFGKDELYELQERTGREELAPAEAQLKEAGIPFTSHVVVGRKAETIAGLVSTLHCDRVVFGDAGVRGSMLGSVAQQVRNLLAGTATTCEVSGS